MPVRRGRDTAKRAAGVNGGALRPALTHCEGNESRSDDGERYGAQRELREELGYIEHAA
jgi:hypothetical protein